MYRNITLIIITMVSLLQISLVKANTEYSFRHLDIVDGMSDNQIRGLSKLSDGRIAIRTASILNLYNGATFEHFYHNKTKEYKWDYWGLPKEYTDVQNRLWMKERDYLLLLDLNSNSFIYDIPGELKTLGITEKLKNLFIDDAKNIWFLTENLDFSYYDQTAKKLIEVTDGKSEFTKQFGVPKEMAQYKNFCWIVYTSGVIRCWDYTSREFVSQDNSFITKINEKTDRIYIHTTNKGDVWLMYNDAINFFNRTNNVWTEVATIKGRSNFFTCMDLDKNGNVWVGTSLSGLRFIDAKTFETNVIPGMKLYNGDILVNDIHNVFVDDNDGLWVGTLFQGLCYYQPSVRKFNLIQTVKSAGTMTSENVRCLYDEGNGKVLVGTANGLFRFNQHNKQLERVYPELAHELCLAIYKDSRKRLWVSTYLGGFYCIEGKSVKNYKWNLNKSQTEQIYYNARYLYEDKNGRLWVSVNGGVGEFFPEQNRIKMLYETHPKVSYHKLDYEIFPINDNSFGVIGESGIYFYNTLTDSLYIPEIDTPENNKYLKNTRYYCHLNDSRSLEWMASERQLNIWDEENKRHYKLTTEEGLPSNTVSALFEDDNKIIWASTANGISRIQVQLTENGYVFSIVNFNTLNGLQSGKFYSQSGIKTSDGTIYFGGVHGFNYFNPEQIIYNTQINTPIFTSFSLFNSVIKVGEKNKNRIILEKPINITKKIVLKYNENFISVDFAGLNYVNPERTYFKYKLENFDQNWTEIITSGSGKVTYTSLKPGTYRFIVFTANSHKLWGEIPAELLIVVKPPFWATTLAYIIYLLIMIYLTYYLFKRIEEKNKKKFAIQQEANEQKQRDELAQMKFRFFTNISHEFRTPLTLIITPLELLLKDEVNPKRINKINSVLKNANELLGLVNQLLDFRKLELEGEKLHLTKNNIGQFIENIYLQFKDTVSAKNIDFTINNEIGNALIFFDANKMHKVVNNLLLNAYKVTSKGGHISIKISKALENQSEYVRISVSDTGCGIDSKHIEKIFDRFFQSEHGENSGFGSSGIGLHLVKSYVELHNGTVAVQSTKDVGSTFTISIPFDLAGEETATEDNVKQINSEPKDDHSKKSKRKTVLLVEDNTEFRNFLVEQLSDEFDVIEAEDGLIGENVARQHSPDLIISDLMMPNQDGIALCRNLKVDIHTSHIPFIMLTARNTDEAKMVGYDAGADSYISKPFNYDMLLVRIKKLIEQQEKRQEMLHKNIEITPSQIAVNSLDEEFIQRVLKYVEKNIDNTEYSIEDLSAEVGLHRSHLYRKIQSLTGHTPLDFMRLVRLKRAAQLLSDSQYYISEIADKVGFNTIKYFNKYFKEEFGLTPTQYRSQNKKTTEETN